MDSQVAIDEVLAHMTPVGRYEFDLAVLRAQSAQKDEIIRVLSEQLQGRSEQPEPAEQPEAKK